MKIVQLSCIYKKSFTFAIMLKSLEHFITYICLVTLLLLNNTSHDFIHSFTGHEDTVDCISGHGDGQHASFENQHHHCSFLDFTFSVYDNSFPHYDFSVNTVEVHFYDEYLISHSSNKQAHTSLRGPPFFEI